MFHSSQVGAISTRLRPGLTCSGNDVLQHLFVQGEICNQFPELAVLVLKLLRPFHLGSNTTSHANVIVVNALGKIRDRAEKRINQRLAAAVTHAYW